MLPLAVVGCDFRVASSVWRSRLVLSDEEARTLAGALRLNEETAGFVDLNTCNRTEWIVSSKDPQWAASLLRGQMIQRAGPGSQGWFSPYVYAGEKGALHLFRVALGQESLVVGERQIAGQLHDALERARARKSSSRILNGLGAATGRLVRTALKQGCMAGSSVGVHSLAVSYLADRLGPRPARVALAGLGQIGRKVLSLLQREKRFTVIPFNRTIDERHAGAVQPLGDLPAALDDVDAVILCTGAPQPVLRAGDLPARSADRELVVVDIGVPRQVECAAVPAHVTICGLDELTTFHRGGMPQPAAATAGDLTQLLDKAVTEFRAFCNQPAFAEIIDSVQRNHGRLVQEQIPRVIDSRLGYLPEDIRARLERDLKGIVLSYTSDVFRTIREASTRYGEETWRDES